MMIGALFPQLQHLADAKERRRVLDRAMEGTFASLRTWSVLGPVCFLCSMALVITEKNCELGRLALPAKMVLVAVCVMGTMWIPALVHRRMIRDRILDDFATRGIRVCRKCNYDLRGTVDGRCPECGEKC
ncbi:MAG: hypothetical protein JXB13_18065 [Phycisphaerae bacterium]|nr:hypothetical protein [Phycisphaerae bacterium]